MDNKQRQLKNGAIYIGMVVVSNVIPLMALPIFTRILTPEDFGLFALAQVYAIFMSGIANFGMRLGYERNFFHYRERESSAQLLYSTLGYVIVGHLIIACATYLFRDQLAMYVFKSSGPAILLFFAFCAVGMTSVNSYFLVYFKNSENAKSFFYYTIGEKLFGVLISLGLIVYYHVGVVGLLWGQLCASVIVFIVLVVRFTRSLALSYNWSILKDSLKLCYPLTPRIFFGVIGTQIDKYLLGLLATIGGVGIYSIGQKAAYLVFTFMTAMQNVFMPQVYKRMFDLGKEGGASIGRYLTPFLYISLAVALVVALFAHEIISALAPAAYHGAADVVIVLSMLYASMFFGKQQQLIYAKKTYMTSLLTIASIGLSIAINIPFIMWWGMMGAAWGALCAGIVSGAVHFIVAQHYYRIRWEFGKVVAIVMLYLVSAISIFMLRRMGVEYEARLFVKAVAALAYLYLGMRLNIVTVENMKLLKDIIPLRRMPSPASN